MPSAHASVRRSTNENDGKHRNPSCAIPVKPRELHREYSGGKGGK